jgi:hypothetical protein
VIPRTRTLAEVEVGEALPELVIEVTPTLVIAGAFASRDLTRVHHDHAEARRRGLAGVIMNTMTTNGLVARFVTDWAGPDAILRRVALKLGTPNVAGDRMRLSGRVTAKDERSGEVALEVVGRNSWGNHVTARVCARLPRAAGAQRVAGGGR